MFLLDVHRYEPSLLEDFKAGAKAVTLMDQASVVVKQEDETRYTWLQRDLAFFYNRLATDDQRREETNLTSEECKRRAQHAVDELYKVSDYHLDVDDVSDANRQVHTPQRLLWRTHSNQQ